jgi:iron-sulfur cluster assembly accessory protein
MTEATVTVSERAARRIRAIAAADPAGGDALRVAVEGGGCSGFQYRLDMVPRASVATGADDVVIERDGAAVVIDMLSLGLLAGSEIDYVDDLIGASFQIRNPNASSSCGCGTSFAL